MSFLKATQGLLKTVNAVFGTTAIYTQLDGGVGQRVGQHEPALGVGVEHLDRRPAVVMDDVTGPLRGAARHVLGEAEVAGDGHRQSELGDRSRAAVGCDPGTARQQQRAHGRADDDAGGDGAGRAAGRRAWRQRPRRTGAFRRALE